MKKEAKYVLTYTELKKYEQRAYNRAVKDMVKYLYGLSYLVLRDRFGFGKTRLKRFISGLSTNLEDLQNGLFELTDIEDIMKDEIGLEIFDGAVFMEEENIND